MKNITRTTHLWVILLAGWNHAQATLIGTESFLTGSDPSSGEYVLTATVTGVNPTVPGWSDAWSTGSFTSTVVQASGLSYAGYSAGAGGALFSSVNNVNGRVARNTSAAFGADGDILYASLLMQLDSVGDQYRAFELNAAFSGSDNDRTVQLGTGSADFPAGNFGLRINNDTNFVLNLGAQDTSVNLFVIRLEYNAGVSNDVVHVWRNPTLGGPEPAPLATLSDVDLLNVGVGRMAYARFNSGADVTWDEVRYGTAWETVVPEPGTFLLVGVGGLLLLRARIKRGHQWLK